MTLSIDPIPDRAFMPCSTYPLLGRICLLYFSIKHIDENKKNIGKPIKKRTPVLMG